MSPSSVPRGIMLPPSGRPRWLSPNPAEAELLYLSWGIRWMGNHPIPLAMHDGWVYAVILEGSPTLTLQQTKQTTAPGDVFIIHPNCGFGWQDKPRRPSRMMTWLWRDPPAHSQLAPPPGAWCRIRVNDRQLRLLVSIHHQCQREVGIPGERALLSLRRSRLDLDITLADALSGPEPVRQQAPIDLALEFLRRHPGVKSPTRSLCEHLNMTPGSLRSLFKEHCQRSPESVALEIRMDYVQGQLLQRKASVKELAAELGYSHANDLSRAYKKYFGTVTPAARPHRSRR